MKSEQTQVNRQKREEKAKIRKRVVNRKPEKFREYEESAKTILEGQNQSYFEWLHKKHEELIVDFTVSNTNKIAELAWEEK